MPWGSGIKKRNPQTGQLEDYNPLQGIAQSVANDPKSNAYAALHPATRTTTTVSQLDHLPGQRTSTGAAYTGAATPGSVRSTQTGQWSMPQQPGGMIPQAQTPGQQQVGQSTATQVPQYQPVGMVRERSGSMDPASFMRRQAYDTAMQNQNTMYGQQARAAQANMQQQAAAAGVQGPAALALQNQAMGQVRDAQAAATGQLSSGYYGAEADAATALSNRDWQTEQSALDRAASVQGQQLGLIGQFAATENMGDKGWRGLQATQALQSGDPNWYRFLDPNWGKPTPTADPTPNPLGDAAVAATGGMGGLSGQSPPQTTGRYVGQVMIGGDGRSYQWTGLQWRTM